MDELLTRVVPTLHQKGLATELVQIILFKGLELEVRLIPIRGREEECLHSRVVEKGLYEVVTFLRRDSKAQDVGVKRVVIFFDQDSSAYKLHRIEYANGQIEHVA